MTSLPNHQMIAYSKDWEPDASGQVEMGIHTDSYAVKNCRGLMTFMIDAPRGDCICLIYDNLFRSTAITFEI